VNDPDRPSLLLDLPRERADSLDLRCGFGEGDLNWSVLVVVPEEVRDMSATDPLRFSFRFARTWAQ